MLPDSEMTATSEAVEGVLLSYQQEWIADESPVKLWEKSRRIGASWGCGADSALYAAASSGDDVWYIGYNKDMAREFIDDVAFWAKHFNVVAESIGEAVIRDEDKDILIFVIKFASGNRVTALSSRPSNLRGKQGRVIIDEAAFHPDLPGLIKSAMALLMWGGSVHIISTHDGEDNPFNNLIRECRAGKLPYSVHRTTFREALGEGLYKRICLRLDRPWSQQAEDKWVASIYEYYGDDASEELDVIPSMGSGKYMPRVLIESCQKEGIPVLTFSKPKEWYLDDNRTIETDAWIADHLAPVINDMPKDQRTVFGLDFGRTGDLSVTWPLQKESSVLWVTPFVLQLRCIPFDMQQKILVYMCNNLPMFRHGKLDARGNGQSHAEYAAQEFGTDKIDQVMFTQQWYATNFPYYRAAFEDKSIVIPKSEDIVIDHGRVILVKGNPGIDDKRDKGSDGGWRHGDAAVAGVLAWAATREDGEPPAGGSVEHDPDVYTPQSSRGRQRTGIFNRKRAA